MLGYARKNDGSLRFKVAAVMDRDESWIRDQFRNAAILSHEQGHFDIAHIFARKLEADLKSKRYRVGDVAELSTLYDNFLEKMNALQMQYDRETRGGLDLKAQARWRKYIHDEINGVANAKGL